jgi:hypothetical protein
VTTDLGTGMTIPDRGCLLALLRDAEVGRLAVVIGDHPDIFPINRRRPWHARSARPRARSWPAQWDRPVAFEVDGYEAASGEAWSVIVRSGDRDR